MKPERFYRFRAGISMIRKSGNRFCDKIMRQQNSMIRKSGNRFCDKIMRQQNSMMRKSGNRFCDKIMRQQNSMIRKSGNRFCDKIMRQQILRAAEDAPGPAPRPNFLLCVASCGQNRAQTRFSRSRVWG